MDEPIPLRTLLTVTLDGVENSPQYMSVVLGYGRYGIQISLPQILNATYALPVQAAVACSYVSARGNQLLGFKSYVMGYERTEPPSMVIQLPTAVEPVSRRKFIRFPVELPVGYLAEGTKVFGEQTRTLDLSLGGLRMVTGRVLAPGTVLAVTIELPGGEIFLAKGVVSWSTFRGRLSMAGVQFTDVREHDRTQLAKFLNGLEREQMKAAPGRSQT
jgi:c-di-GMP-binding flagellar brake protein YcgR